MASKHLSDLEKRKRTYTATGLFVIGAILFVIGSTLLYTVSKAELDEELEGIPQREGLFD
ncbi:hypothetical protein SAMN05421736_101351 [Evansella caseinilytica]|uniref:Uncharacterized protein n=1 Tax=Evansella caseinilytica TaxID=1503961 RepID=A0A1H3H1M1_9BACI|nr:hypothetical protein [Evansella caseinilytica]SDY09422.1 hypothetical protein SAMN05421736_101351 [Evansella caseinilytica]